MFKTIKLFLLATIVAIFVIPNLAFAQQAGDIPTTQAGSSCTDLPKDLTYKISNDSNSNGKVSELQSFLQEQGLLTSDPTGYFGGLTFNAVKTFQSRQGLLAYGFVGPVTRDVIKNVSCSGAPAIGSPTQVYPFPLGCSSTAGFSSVTGQSCLQTPTNLPVGCSSTSGYSPITGQSCGNSVSCPNGYALVNGACQNVSNVNCPVGTVVNNGVCQSTIINTNTPIIEFIGTPMLRLQSDGYGHEGLLVGSAMVKITTGNQAINIAYVQDNAQVAKILQFNNEKGATYSNSMRFSAVGFPACIFTQAAGCLIPANSSMTFNIKNTVKTSELFSGNYSIAPTNFTYYDPNNSNNSLIIQPQDFRGISSSNSVVVIGETSPYINSISTMTDVSGNLIGYNIWGTRFDPTTNYVNINGVTKVFSTNASDKGPLISFKPSDFGITSSGTYMAQVSTSNGTSNYYSFNAGNIVGPNGPQTVSLSSAPYISSLSPSSGPVGTTVVINGTNLNTVGNSVYIDNILVDSLSGGTSVRGSFVIPAGLSVGVHQVKGLNSNCGTSNCVSNLVPFTVTSLLVTGKTASTDGRPVPLYCGDYINRNNLVGNNYITYNPDANGNISFYSDVCKQKGVLVWAGCPVGFTPSIPAVAVDDFNGKTITCSPTGSTNTNTNQTTTVTSQQTAVSPTFDPFIQVTILPAGTAGSNYSTTLTSITMSSAGVTGISSPSDLKVWSLSYGALPSGLTLSSSGVISGIPSINAVTSTFTVAVTVNGKTATRSMTININPTMQSLPPTIVVSRVPSVGTPGTSYTVTWNTTGNVTNVNWSCTAGPNGGYSGSGYFPQTINSINYGVSGSISGTYTADMTGSSNCTWTATNSSSAVSSTNESFTVNPAPASVPLPTASLLINGVKNSTITAGTMHLKEWHSANGTSWNSTYSFAQDPSSAITCSHVEGPLSWNASGGNSADGMVTNTANKNNVGCIATITYTVSNSAGSVSAVATQTTTAAIASGPVFSLTRITNADQSQTVSWTSSPDITKLDFICYGSNGDIKTGNNLPLQQPAVTNSWDFLTQNGWKGKYTCTYTATGGPMNQNANITKDFYDSFEIKATKVLGDYISNVPCTDIPRNLHRGAESSSVKNLQSFLVQKGLLSDAPTGFYGDKTVEAVSNYQSSKGLPVTGMVYDFTRQAIKAETCK